MSWTWWMTLAVIFAVLILIGCIPVGVDVRYDQNGAAVTAKAGFLKIQILPKKKKEKPEKPKKEKPKKEKKKAKPDGKKDASEKSGETEKKKPSLLANGVDSVLELLDIVSDTLGNLRRKLRVNTLRLFVTYGGSDPAKAAIGYGRAWAVIGAISPYLERFFVIKKRDIRPVLEYNSDRMQIDAQLTLTITIGRILALAARAGIRFLKFMANNKKGGVKNESSSC